PHRLADGRGPARRLSAAGAADGRGGQGHQPRAGQVVRLRPRRNITTRRAKATARLDKLTTTPQYRYSCLVCQRIGNIPALALGPSGRGRSASRATAPTPHW